MFLDRLFYRIKHQKTDLINVEDFKGVPKVLMSGTPGLAPRRQGL